MARVAHIPYLEKTSSGFRYRRRFPPSFLESKLVQKSFFCVSLRTHLPVEARSRAQALTALCDLGFALIRDRKMQHLAPEHVTLLTELARFRVAAFEAARAVAPPRSEAEANQAAAIERATQATLRRAIALGDREIARAPLREVAAELGIPLGESTPDYLVLAHEATRVLLDVSAECERRHVGLYEGPTVFFRSAMARPAVAGSETPALTVAGRRPEVAAPGPNLQVPSAPSVPAIPPASAPFHIPHPPLEGDPQVQTIDSKKEIPIPMDDLSLPPETRTLPAGLLTGTALADIDLSDAARLEMIARAARSAARPPKILVDRSLLSPESQAALKKARGITLFEGFQLYIELKKLGYGEEFGKQQKRNPRTGEQWAQSSQRNAEMARDIWIDLLDGDGPFEDVASPDVNDALTIIQCLPSKHGKGADHVATDGYRDLVERADDMERTEEAKRLKALGRRGTPTEAEKEQARLDSLVPRIRAETFLRHGRFPNRVGKMLLAMQLIDENPFEICRWSNREEKDLKAQQEDRSRTIWDDRIYRLFRSPVFQGDTREPGDPLFWAPLIARFQGLREEECLQLRPEDFGSEDGIPYFRVRNCDGNSVKSTAGERKLPVHPALSALGLLKLVELRSNEGQPRLFPHLKRGQIKGTFTEIFSKAFGYYRQTNGCYWRGLDFHAFRTTFHGDLLNDDKSDAIRRRLMGHEPLDEGERSYAQGLKLRTLLKRLQSVEVDTSMIVSPFGSEAGTARAKAAERGLRVI